MDKFQIFDKNGQQKVVNQLQRIFTNHKLDVNQHFVDKSTVDIDMVVTTPLGHKYKYWMEAKDRTYSHTAFGGEWMIEEHKYNELLNREGKVFYVNTFGDDYIAFWDLKKINKSELRTEYKLLPRTTVEDRGKVEKLVYYLPIDKAVYAKPFI